MKRAGLWAIGIGLLVNVGPLAVEQGYAGDHEGKCTLTTLKGQYLFAGSAMLFPPAFGIPEGTPPSVGSSAGYHIFNGDGTGIDFVTATLNGVDQHVPSPVLITYTLNHDCTGTYSVQNGPNFDIFVAFDGSQLAVIGTDPGAAGLEIPSQRVGSSKRAE